MKKTTSILITLSTLLFGLLSASVSLGLEPFHHEYKSTFAGFKAKSSRSLAQLEDGSWELRISSRNFVAKYNEISHFRLDEIGYPIPIENRFEGRLFGAKRQESSPASIGMLALQHGHVKMTRVPPSSRPAHLTVFSINC